jgi:hypothetical protein
METVDCSTMPVDKSMILMDCSTRIVDKEIRPVD